MSAGANIEVYPLLELSTVFNMSHLENVYLLTCYPLLKYFGTPPSSLSRSAVSKEAAQEKVLNLIARNASYNAF